VFIEQAGVFHESDSIFILMELIAFNVSGNTD